MPWYVYVTISFLGSGFRGLDRKAYSAALAAAAAASSAVGSGAGGDDEDEPEAGARRGFGRVCGCSGW